MNKRQSVKLVGLMAAIAMAPAGADENSEAVNQEIKAQLEQAKDVILEAEKTAEEIIRSAQVEAQQIRKDAVVNEDLAPLELQNQRVAIEISAGTIEEIVTQIMPSDWRVLVDVKDQDITERRFQFVSTRTREQALNDLLKPIGMKHQYFFDLKDSQGNNSPLLVVSVER